MATPNPKSRDPIGPQLRRLRESLGLSLSGVEEKSNGHWKGVVVGSYERGDRHVTLEKCRELLAWYGGRTIEVLAPGDVVVRAGGDRPDGDVEYVVVYEDRAGGTGLLEIPCKDHNMALRISANMPESRVGYRAHVVTELTYLGGAS